MADRLAVMRDGLVVEEGPPEALFAAPATAFVARFLAGANVVEAPALAARLAGAPGPEGHALAVAPEALRLVEADAEGAVPVRVVGRLFQGPYAEWAVEAEGEGGPVPLRVWTVPSTPAPAAPAVRAARSRWVRAEAA